MNKRLSKPRTQYSPSDPIATTTYHLMICSSTGNMVIIGNSSVKRINEEGILSLNDGRKGKLLTSGTKEKCIQRWNDMVRENIDSNIDEAEEEDDNSFNLIKQTLQAPTTTFMTPAPYRRKKEVTVRSISPDLIGTNSPVKRFAGMNGTVHSSQQAASNQNHKHTLLNCTDSSSEEESIIDNGDDKLLKRIFRELKHTQSNVKGARTENQDIFHKITKLTQKINQFKSLVFSKQDTDLDQYRDPNQKETYTESIIFDGRDLLNEPARNPGQYARNLLRILFTSEELQSSLLPSTQSKRYLKPELDKDRMDLLNDAVRTRYRIGRYHYDSFYRERIQNTLAACVYNEGRRKLKFQSSSDNNRTNSEEKTLQQSTSSITIERNEREDVRSITDGFI